MDVAGIILRLIHILSGVFWVGAGLMMAGFVVPAAAAVGQDAQKFMQQLTQRSKFVPVVLTAATLTVLSGLILYQRRFGDRLVLAGPGLALTIGGAVGLVALAIAFFVQLRLIRQIGALGQKIAAGGGPPKPEQLAEMQSLQGKSVNTGNWLAVLLTIALIGMSIGG